MTIDEAITVQAEMLDVVYNAKSPQRSSALKLGIEALKRIKEARSQGLAYAGYLLKDETET